MIRQAATTDADERQIKNATCDKPHRLSRYENNIAVLINLTITR